MELSRLVVEIDADLKRRLMSHCQLNGTTAKYVITKLLYELLKGNKNGKPRQQTKARQYSRI